MEELICAWFGGGRGGSAGGSEGELEESMVPAVGEDQGGPLHELGVVGCEVGLACEEGRKGIFPRKGEGARIGHQKKRKGQLLEKSRSSRINLVVVVLLAHCGG